MLPLVRNLASPARTAAANRRLGALLAFVAGATNAGGFLAIGRYTSHMTGVVSSMADDLVLGDVGLVMTGLAALVAFLLGAMTTAIMINWTRRRRLRSTFALPLMLEALLLLCFGLLGATLDQRLPLMVPATVLILCYLMGLQNAVITKVSRAEIRTTHMTGIITDLGIELGKLSYRNVSPGDEPVRADRIRLRLHLLLLGAFFMGGVIGALGFRYFGFSATIPLALLLAAAALRPLIDDATLRYRLVRRNVAAPGPGAPTPE